MDLQVKDQNNRTTKMNLKPDEAYREQRDIVREQIEQLTKLEEKSESDRPPSNTAV